MRGLISSQIIYLENDTVTITENESSLVTMVVNFMYQFAHAARVPRHSEYLPENLLYDISIQIWLNMSLFLIWMYLTQFGENLDKT